jgi:IclR family pca regulon transcriptional regulator
VRSVEKALRILELFDESRPQLTLAQIVELTGMNRVTTYRFCRTLEHLGYLETVGDRSYRPGVKVLYLGHAALTSRDLREIALPALERLREETGETANIAVRDGTEIVYLARMRSNAILSIRLFEGSRLPLYCTSMGKAILAYLPPPELDALLTSLDFRAFTESTVKNAKALRKVLATVRDAGYAVNDEEYAPGLRGIAAPIFDANSYPVGAINLATGTPVSIHEFKNLHAAKVVETARSISEIWATVSSHMDLSAPSPHVAGSQKERT